VSQETGATRGGIGARLKAARERRGLSLLQAAEKLHVDSHVLEALEAERFAALDAPVFVRGHIRRYAELVGESPAELSELYSGSADGARPPDLTRVPKGKSDADTARLRGPGVAIIVATGLIGSIWWVAGALHAPQRAQPVEGAGVRGTAIERPQDTALAGVNGMPTRTAAAQPVGATVATAPAKAAVVPTAMATGTQAVTVAPGAADAGAGPGRRAEPPRRLTELTLRFAGDSWAEVYDASGERLFYDVGPADSVRSVKGLAPLRVVLANAPGVGVEVNGRTISVPNAPATGQSVEFAITRSGRVVPATAAAQGRNP
jgi:cytoskeleton protein RodZ